MIGSKVNSLFGTIFTWGLKLRAPGAFCVCRTKYKLFSKWFYFCLVVTLLLSSCNNFYLAITDKFIPVVKNTFKPNSWASNKSNRTKSHDNNFCKHSKCNWITWSCGLICHVLGWEVNGSNLATGCHWFLPSPINFKSGPIDFVQKEEMHREEEI